MSPAVRARWARSSATGWCLPGEARARTATIRCRSAAARPSRSPTSSRFRPTCSSRAEQHGAGSRNRLGLPGGGAGRDRRARSTRSRSSSPRASRPRKRLEELGYGNIEVRIGDGYKGWPEKAPFDAHRGDRGGAARAAGARRAAQARRPHGDPGGRRGRDPVPEAASTKRADGGVDEKRVLPVRFVPLVPGKVVR